MAPERGLPARILKPLPITKKGGLEARAPGLRPGFHFQPGMRVGLYGGSFDPAHGGHAHVAQTARKRLGLDRVIWLVSPQNPLKHHSARDRYAARLVGAARHAVGPSMIVSDIEARLGLAYTVDTVRWFRHRYPAVRFVWIMGADGLAGFHRWKGWVDLMRIVPVAVISRPGVALRSRLSPAARRFAFARLSRSLGMPTFARPPRWLYLTARFDPTSSTALRRRAH